jgi:uncharacterized protein YceK
MTKFKSQEKAFRCSVLLTIACLFLVSGCSTTDVERSQLVAPEGKVILIGSLDELPTYGSNLTIGIENRDTGFYTNLTKFGSNSRRVNRFAFVADAGTYFFLGGETSAFYTGDDRYIYLGRFDFDLFVNDFSRLKPMPGNYREVRFTVSDQWEQDRSWIVRNHPEIPLDEVVNYAK